jgi:hypothetical protein
MRIYKYRLIKSGSNPNGFYANIENGSVVLRVDAQRGDFCVWVLVDPSAQKKDRQFMIYGTGQDLPDPMGTYINTFFEDSFVWHAFEI